MIKRYKGSYSPIFQYMPNKHEKWSLKVWCVACSISTYVWNFEIYCGKEIVPPPLPQEMPSHGPPRPSPPLPPPRAPRDETHLAHNVVLRLLEGLWNIGHIVMMDQFFNSIGLFMDFLARGTYVIGIFRSNKKGLPSHLKNERAFKNVP